MTKRNHVTFLSSLGAGLEYYDFIIFGLLSPYLSRLFFSGAHGEALAKTFMLFALGYFIRPLGGLFFGLWADQRGRRRTFAFIMLCMGLSTFAMGLLPTHDHVGALAPVMLLMLRAVQSFSFGAELPGAITVLKEYHPRNKTGFHGGFVISSTAFGSSLATGVLSLLAAYVSVEHMDLWGWRLPFLLGGVLAVVSYFIRKNLHETPEFLDIHQQRQPREWWGPLMALLRHGKKNLLMCFFLNLFPATFIIIHIYFPAYVGLFFPHHKPYIYQAMTASTLITAVLPPLFGWLGDRYGRERFLRLVTFVFALTCYPMFSLFHDHGFGSLLTVLIYHQIIICACIPNTLMLSAERFPTAQRFTAVALCYNLAYIVASLVPLAMTGLFASYSCPTYLLAPMLGVAFFAMGAVFGKFKG